MSTVNTDILNIVKGKSRSLVFRTQSCFLADLFADFIQKLLRKKDKKLAIPLNSTFRYIDDVLSLNNSKIGDYVQRIYHIEQEDSFANIKSFFDRIRQYSNRCVLPVLVGNKVDTTDDRAIGKLLAEDFANEHDIPYIETSAKDGTMVNELFKKVLKDIINPSEEVKQRQWRPFTSADLNSCKSCKCAIS
ncbi:ras-related protein RabF1-like [Mytilus trossulus]|uniref:ras-related protein RabF1-like n=1 Tax=Mytilus trossulus TaxID=6551 RepID=UPI003006531C